MQAKDMFIIRNGHWEYSGGKGDWQTAAGVAAGCQGFLEDDEDELAAEEPVSCYNCRYRRWTPDSFLCMGPVKARLSPAKHDSHESGGTTEPRAPLNDKAGR